MVLKSLLSAYLRSLLRYLDCRKPQEVVRTFDRSPFGGSRNTRSRRTERTVEFHQGFLGRPGHGIVGRIKPDFLVQSLSWGIKNHRHALSEASTEWANESISRLKTESFRQDFRHMDTAVLCRPLVARRSCSVTYPLPCGLGDLGPGL
jgi:hypothetical protein